MTCENLCDSSVSAPRREVTVVPNNHLSRRALLGGVAAVMAGIGLAGPAESALAAAKTYTVGKTTEIPVGSAKMYQVAGVPVIVTQPKKGVFKAFNGYCTHQQVQLDSINGSNLICSQHGSSFNTTTGKVTGGPARSSLANYKASVSGTTLKISL
jgi:nitrite reductase/ring-hydroxylating ferredoxin subunit